MRTITNKYKGTCRKCGKELPIGSSVGYERHIGIFCLECMPEAGSEELRAYRQDWVDKKAQKYEEWAEKRRTKAEEVFSADRHLTSDIAYITQPGHIPGRDKLIAREEKQFESLTKAKEMDEKAADLRRTGAVVKGDAERQREVEREEVLTWLKVGCEVSGSFIRGKGIVKKINKKTALVFDDFWANNPNYHGQLEQIYWLRKYEKEA